jgi:hypothetical protein
MWAATLRPHGLRRDIDALAVEARTLPLDGLVLKVFVAGRLDDEAVGQLSALDDRGRGPLSASSRRGAG